MRSSSLLTDLPLRVYPQYIEGCPSLLRDLVHCLRPFLAGTDATISMNRSIGGSRQEVAVNAAAVGAPAVRGAVTKNAQPCVSTSPAGLTLRVASSYRHRADSLLSHLTPSWFLRTGLDDELFNARYPRFHHCRCRSGKSRATVRSRANSGLSDGYIRMAESRPEGARQGHLELLFRIRSGLQVHNECRTRLLQGPCRPAAARACGSNEPSSSCRWRTTCAWPD